MGRLLMFHVSYCILHLMHYTMLCSAHVYPYTLDPAELELEEPTKPALVEESANTELTEGKPRCIPPISLDFWFSINISITVWLCIKFTGFVWHYSCTKISFPIILIYPCYNSYRSLAMATRRHRKLKTIGRKGWECDVESQSLQGCSLHLCQLRTEELVTASKYWTYWSHSSVHRLVNQWSLSSIDVWLSPTASTAVRGEKLGGDLRISQPMD
jgi:hypothetical protein